VVVLALAALVYLGYGFAMTWGRNYDGDLEERAREYALFRIGVYPHYKIERAPAGFNAVGSVYPPYAYPQMALFFEPGGKLQARILIELLSLASLALMAWFAHHTLRPYGREIALVGAVAVVAIAGNGTALALGQFSIICVGLITVQWLAILGRRPIVAGIAWGMAMLKPQIALPFVLLFFLAGQGSGALRGVGLLAGLTLFACVWTDVPLTGIVAHWSGGMSLRFTEETSSLGPGAVAKVLGADPRVMQVVALLVLTAVGAAVALFIRRAGPRALLPVAGACAVAGMLFCYHRRYDDVMLCAALLAAIASAASSKRPAAVFVAGSMLTLLLLPYQLVDRMPAIKIVECVVWVTACLISLRSLATPREPPAGDLDRPLHAAS